MAPVVVAAAAGAPFGVSFSFKLSGRANGALLAAPILLLEDPNELPLLLPPLGKPDDEEGVKPVLDHFPSPPPTPIEFQMHYSSQLSCLGETDQQHVACCA